MPGPRRRRLAFPLPPRVRLWFGLALLVLVGMSTATRPMNGAAAVGPGVPGINPFLGARFFVDPSSPAAADVAAYLRAGDTQDAALMDKIASHSYAFWMGQWDAANPAAAARQEVGREIAAGALPILVLYNIPGRDCGSYSAGGAPSPAAYRAWIRGVATGIRGHRVVTILEPDALPELACWNRREQRQNVSLIAWAARQLRAAGAVVYLDAGNPGWQPVATMARRLRAAGIGSDRGFVVNVASFWRTPPTERYGDRLSRLLGGSHYIIDTSRNGQGAAPVGKLSWCNPPGRGLGTPDTTDTGDPHVDALLWVKQPGTSDGTCNGGPVSGAWWSSYALMLARNADF